MVVFACSWKADGSIDSQAVNFSDTPNGETNVEIDASAVQGSPVNLMAEQKDCNGDNKEDGSSPSIFPESYWFAVTIGDLGNNDSNSISIGAVTPTEFQKGWKNKGMFYNGNLTNCGAGLKINYGPYLKSGDRCVLECASTPAAFSMTIYLNGARVGKGFEIQNPSPQKRFFPCVSVEGKVKFTSKVTTEQPSDLLLSPKKTEHPLNGKWTILEAKTSSGSEQFLPVPRKVIMNIIVATDEESENPSLSLSVTVTVVNTMRVTKGYKPRTAEENLNSGGGGDGGGKIYDLISTGAPSMMMMTLMGVYPPYDRVEREMSSAIAEGWKSIQFLPNDDGGELKIIGGDDDNIVVARCVRYKNDDTAPLTIY